MLFSIEVSTARTPVAALARRPSDTIHSAAFSAIIIYAQGKYENVFVGDLFTRALWPGVPVYVLAAEIILAGALAWALYLLASRPDVVGALRSEISSVLGSRAPVEADLARLPYVGAVFSETLRLYPPGWGFGRKALRATSVGGYQIPAGTVVWMSPWVMHRDSRWFSDPLSFAPERWLAGLHRTLPRGAYIPFGLGPRRCLGSSFATLEGTLALVELVRRFDFSLPPTVSVLPKPSLT